jgi:hypothetical protein
MGKRKPFGDFFDEACVPGGAHGVMRPTKIATPFYLAQYSGTSRRSSGLEALHSRCTPRHNCD